MKECFNNMIQEEDLNDMESFFNIVKLPAGPIKLDKCSTITDVSLFVGSHLSILKAQKGNARYRPYLDKLIELKHIINHKL